MALERKTIFSLGGPTYIPDERVAEQQRQQSLNIRAGGQNQQFDIQQQQLAQRAQELQMQDRRAMEDRMLREFLGNETLGLQRQGQADVNTRFNATQQQAMSLQEMLREQQLTDMTRAEGRQDTRETTRQSEFASELGIRQGRADLDQARFDLEGTDRKSASKQAAIQQKADILASMFEVRGADREAQEGRLLMLGEKVKLMGDPELTKWFERESAKIRGTREKDMIENLTLGAKGAKALYDGDIGLLDALDSSGDTSRLAKELGLSETADSLSLFTREGPNVFPGMEGARGRAAGGIDFVRDVLMGKRTEPRDPRWDAPRYASPDPLEAPPRVPPGMVYIPGVGVVRDENFGRTRHKKKARKGSKGKRGGRDWVGK